MLELEKAPKPGSMEEWWDFASKPQIVPPTPGVNAPVPLNAPTPAQPALAGHTVIDYLRDAPELFAELNDPNLAKDRRKAEAELASRFIIDDKTTGDRLPNQITSSEFRRVARLYSDIRLGRGDLVLDPGQSKNPDQFRADMMDDLGDILQTKSGRELVGALSNSTNGVDPNGKPIHRKTTLKPFFNEDGSIKDDDARETPDGGGLLGQGSPFPDGRPGVGTNTIVEANPNVDVVERNQPGGEVISRIRSDVALFHELVHSYTDTRGITSYEHVHRDDSPFDLLPFPVKMPRDPDTVIDADAGIRTAEHQAAGLGRHRFDPLTENAYRRERAQVAKSGRGIAGDLLMGERKNYLEAASYFTMWGM